MNTSLPKRKSPRAHWLEYNEGMYFITVCTHAHRQILGKVRDGVMSLSRLGEYLDTCLKNVSLHQANVEVIQYVIMPNHFHAIVDIRQKDALANEADTAAVSLRGRSVLKTEYDASGCLCYQHLSAVSSLPSADMLTP